MRLSEVQKNAIVAAVKEGLNAHGELYLYGSRADDTLKGGDIDLVFITSTVSNQDLLDLSKKIGQVLVGIKKKIGDQRVDFSIVTVEQSRSDSFWRASLTQAVLLSQM